MWDNKKTIAASIGLLIILNITTLLNQRNMRRNFEQQIMYLNSQIGGLSSQVSNFNLNIGKFNEEQKWVNSNSYKVTGYDSVTGLIKTDVSWSFRELSPNSIVYLAYGEVKDNPQGVDKWNNMKATSVDSLNFKADISLLPDKKYRLKTQSDSSSGARGEDFMEIDMVGIIQNRFNLMPSFDPDKGPRNDNHILVANNSQGSELLSIKSAKAQVYVDGKLQNTVELHRATEQEINKDMMQKYVEPSWGEVWLNDDAVWTNGEENWVKSGNNSWTYKGNNPPNYKNIRIDVTIVDNMGLTYKKTYDRGF